MPRTGRHPLKSLSESKRLRKRLSIATIVYIPTLSGYWEESLEIFNLFIESIYKNTSEPFDLVVFDNGSCQEVLDYLLDLKASGEIQYLILSHENQGKTGGLNSLLEFAQGEFVTYADSDLYFLPGWFETTSEVFKTFPKAGKVTSLPITMDTYSETFDIFFRFALSEAESDLSINIQHGELVDEKYINAHRVSLGESKEQYSARARNKRDFLLTKNGCQVFISGSDHQFTIRRAAIEAILPLDLDQIAIRGDAIYTPLLEQKLAESGFWQLSTSEYYVHHMGNSLPDFEKELHWIDPKDLPTSAVRTKDDTKKDLSKKTLFYRLTHLTTIRKILKRIHLVTYKLLYE